MADNVASPAPASRASRAFAWTALLLAAAVLRITPLTQSLWYDEVWRTRLVLSGARGLNVLLHDVHNPLYNAFMWVWIRLVGDSELAIRTPSLIAGLLAAFIVKQWGTRAISPRAGNLAAAWLLLSPVHVWYSAEAKNSMFILLFGLLGAFTLDEAARRRTPAAVACAALALAAAVWTDFQTLLVLVPFALATLRLLMRRPRVDCGHWPASREPSALRRAAPVLVAVGGAAVLAAPLLLYKSHQLDQLPRDYLRYFHAYRVLTMLVVFFPTGSAIRTSIVGEATQTLLGLVLLGPIFAAGIRQLWRGASGRAILLTVMLPLICMWFLSDILVWSGSRVRLYQERNLICVLPFLALLLGAGAAACPRPWRRAAPAIILILAGVSSALIYTWRRHDTTVMSPAPDWRALASTVRAAAPADPPPLVFSRTPLLPLEYYLPAAEFLELPREGDAAETVRQVLATNAYRDVTLVVNPNWWPLSEDELRRAGLPPAVLHFRSLHVWRFPPQSAAPASQQLPAR